MSMKDYNATSAAPAGVTIEKGAKSYAPAYMSVEQAENLARAGWSARHVGGGTVTWTSPDGDQAEPLTGGYPTVRKLYKQPIAILSRRQDQTGAWVYRLKRSLRECSN